MADTPAKRMREAKKRQKQEHKAERKRLRKEGLLGTDNSGLFAPGEIPRETVDNPSGPPPSPSPSPSPTQE